MTYTNQNHMMSAVLEDEQLMKKGEYTHADIPDNIFIAMDSANYLIKVVSTIIHRHAEGSTPKEIYNQINQYLQNNL